jgi:predicted ATPase
MTSMEHATLVSFGFGLFAGATAALLSMRRQLILGIPEKATPHADVHHLSLSTMASLAAKGAAVPQSSKRVFRVCLTGGPCSGKSSSLAAFARELTARGFDVYCLPEVPTLIMNTGFPYPGIDGGDLLREFEDVLFGAQLQLESLVTRLAEARDRQERHRPAVIFFDRALLDMKAYMPPAMWADLLRSYGLAGGEAEVMARYDLVLHLVTAADGALHAYTLANNAARTETAAQAVENDRRVRVAWAAHPRVAVVDNSGPSFQDKIDRASRHVLALVAPGTA